MVKLWWGEENGAQILVVMKGVTADERMTCDWFSGSWCRIWLVDIKVHVNDELI